MKRFLIIVSASLLGFAVQAQEAVVDFEAASWDALIDNPQYNGPLIYSANEYKWTDEATSLSSECVKADWSRWGMGYGWDKGIAISNYVDATATSFDKQLSVPVSNGSRNFAVLWENGSELTFADGKAHAIKCMDVINTSLTLYNIKKECGDGYYFKVKAIGHNGLSRKTVEIKLAEGENYIDAWTTIDLSALGQVKRVEFQFDGTNKNSAGLLTPKYFAFDNVKVEVDATAIEDVTTSTAHTTCYGANGERLDAPRRGLNIVRMADGTSRKVIIR